MPVLQMLGDALLGESHNVLASILIVRQSAFDKLVDDGDLGLGREQVGIMRGRRSVCTACLHRHTPHVAPHLALFNASDSSGGVYGLDRPDDGYDVIFSQRDAVAGPGATICDVRYNTDAPHLMSPAIVQFVGGTPADATANSRRMLSITLGNNPAFTLPALNFGGTPAGIDARLVIDSGILPIINTGIAHKKAGVGQIGAGITTAPMECFNDGLAALAKTLQGPSSAPVSA